MIDESGECIMEYEIIFLAGTSVSDFTLSPSEIGIAPNAQEANVLITLEPDTVSQEPPEIFMIEARGIITRPLQSNEFIRRSKTVTIIDQTRKQ